jgi:hypothetical protein
VRRRASRGSDAIGSTAARAQLVMLLASCTDDRLAGMTVDGLASSYRSTGRKQNMN